MTEVKPVEWIFMSLYWMGMQKVSLPLAAEELREQNLETVDLLLVKPLYAKACDPSRGDSE